MQRNSNGGHGIPRFPGKKWFGNKKTKFLEQRMNELQMYFNSLLCLNKYAKNQLVMVYFSSKATDSLAQDEITKLNGLINHSRNHRPVVVAPKQIKTIIATTNQ
jgi:hypothetical protein